MHKICKKYMQKYANICNLYAKICKYMQHSLCHRNMQKYAKICKVYACYMQKHAKYAITFFICRICKNMHSPLCWCSHNVQGLTDQQHNKHLTFAFQAQWLALNSCSSCPFKSSVTRGGGQSPRALTSLVTTWTDRQTDRRTDTAGRKGPLIMKGASWSAGWAGSRFNLKSQVQVQVFKWASGSKWPAGGAGRVPRPQASQ